MDLVHNLSDRLLFAVPKKGRLNEACLNLLSGSDIQFHRHSRLDIALVKNLPIALIFLPAADIPTFVGEGRVDLGITGQDQVAEHFDRRDPSTTRQRYASDGTPIEQGVEEVMDLGFGRCKLQVQVPEKGSIQEPKDLVGKDVVTSYTNLAEEYFRALEGGNEPLKTRIKYVGGSVEAACALGVADAVVDLVESGETMRAAGLKAIDTVTESSAVLIKSKRPSNPQLVELITSRIRGVITAQRYVLCTYNIQRSKLDQAVKITPGKRAPTITSLEEQSWVAVSSMVERSKMAVIMDQIMDIGGSDILITKIENSRGT
ncbi:ATP phosphoribosyltransferase [Myriangium duriaei CBS 260.36]|uniref:ATP phosphoribosyltransferase n=1 Tax=Myriangium duriaei CBS 260.36 TaxID=1168546 RepID=A0A9P4IY37_9PEZI|nr:ATP phosphoribosyltransferase [Myriangium duriaei CBS 260.36]